MEAFLTKQFPLLVAATILVTMTLQILSMRSESQTWDEGLEVASGYAYLRTGDYRMVAEHPPLWRVLAALPLLVLNPATRADDTAWERRDAILFGRVFLYANRVSAERIVFAARLPMVALTGLLICAVACWTRRHFGALAGLLAALLIAFDPNILAHGHYIKNDVPVTLFGFIAVCAFAEYALTLEKRWLAAACVGFACALLTKFSALYLVPVLAILWLIGRPRAPFKGIAAFALLGLTSFLAVSLAYAPYWHKLIPATRRYRASHPEARLLVDAVYPSTALSKSVVRVAAKFGAQDHPFLTGLVDFSNHASQGHPAYLFGTYSESGWWYYFPAAFALKTPLATLLLLALALAHIRRPGYALWVCAVPIAVYAWITLANHVDIGLRHILPVYPFLYSAAAGLLAAGSLGLRKYAIPLLAAALLVESISIYPHYLAFFNAAAGGPANGPRYLVDSNLDWGQDLIHLRDYWIARGRPKLCLMYFGAALPEYFGMHYHDVPSTADREAQANANCLAAVSVTPLYGVYVAPDHCAWLRQRKPDRKIGYSIYVYDLRH